MHIIKHCWLKFLARSYTKFSLVKMNPPFEYNVSNYGSLMYFFPVIQTLMDSQGLFCLCYVSTNFTCVSDACDMLRFYVRFYYVLYAFLSTDFANHCECIIFFHMLWTKSYSCRPKKAYVFSKNSCSSAALDARADIWNMIRSMLQQRPNAACAWKTGGDSCL